MREYISARVMRKEYHHPPRGMKILKGLVFRTLNIMDMISNTFHHPPNILFTPHINAQGVAKFSAGLKW